MSRARWTNPLSWQDDETRGPLVDILDELTRGTSCWNETCTYYPEFGRWMICFTYSFPENHALSSEWCTWADDPELPPAIGPGPPPPDWPELSAGAGMSIFPNAGTISCWGIFAPDGTDFIPGLGPWGGYRARFPGFTIGDLWCDIYPIAWEPGVITWRCDYLVVGGGTGTDEVTEFGGAFPLFTFLPGTMEDCPEVWLTVSLSWPG